MNSNNTLVVFEDKKIRRTWHNNEWWFVIADIVEALTDLTNPRQYIQRRGRALRNYKDKPLVQIFDILAFPKDESKGYHGLIKSQLLRAWAFIGASQSPEEKAKLIDIRMKYGIPSEELTKEIEGW